MRAVLLAGTTTNAITEKEAILNGANTSRSGLVERKLFGLADSYQDDLPGPAFADASVIVEAPACLAAPPQPSIDSG